MAQVREKEKERIFDRKLLKEREQEDAQFGDKPKFLTAAYKQKLLDEKKWEYEDKLAEEVERRTDVRGSGMTGFYANLLTKNIAMGGDVGSSSTSAYTVGNERQKRLINGTTADEISSTADLQVKGPDNTPVATEPVPESSSSATTIQLGNKHERDDEDDEEHNNHNHNARPDSQTRPPAQKPRIEEASGHKREEAVLSARERFLARKQQQQQQQADSTI